MSANVRLCPRTRQWDVSAETRVEDLSDVRLLV